ncbi:hypothetical protein V8038_001787 [Vibrio parahaemolyticus]|uniref:hypothetical protein n=2 Tax=Vibrio parahaemolyticus TaxID=670 RepID=UPI0006A62328|nr:hypothetical protein [Vibrio parahaemolyticus]EHR0229187.1 hypothetical protein [Vibrio parahaemolyticus]EHR5999959.1 hypothetical protein [Vibrio parahaemolyticus]EJG1641868.1 hypothetical protein [Vibrio parahaemolyticus]ELA8139736.1 hypothetical protein [Vibrio parahaemolyticus]ELA9310194.1 hypothetical protein [Vibrio parahaemolyticus]
MSYHLHNFLITNLLSESEPSYLFLLEKLYSRTKISKSIVQDLTPENIAKTIDSLTRKRAKYLSVINEPLQFGDNLDNSTLDPIESISISNFRGFGQLNKNDKGSFIEFSTGINLFYAPNGGGKTSLCEAIEYSLTGSIKEADRRNTKLSQYIKRNSTKPQVVANLVDGSINKIDRRRNNCFIDRNRLQEFSLLGSKDTKFTHNDVLAVLFQLEEIDDIIRNTVKPESFKLQQFHADRSQSESALCSKNLEKIQQKTIDVRKDYSENLRSISNLLSLRYIDKYSIRCKLKFLKKYKKNLFDKISKRSKGVKSKEVSLIEFRHWLNKLETARRIKLLIEKSLEDRTRLLSYRELYQSIIDINDVEKCPACHTDINKTVINPLVNSKSELDKLSYLSTLENRLKLVVDSIEKVKSSLLLSIGELSNDFVVKLDAISIVNNLKINLEQGDYSTALSVIYNADKVTDEYNELAVSNNESVNKYDEVTDKLNERYNKLDHEIQLIDDKISTSRKYLERLSEYNKDRLETINQLKVLASKVKQEKYLNCFLVELEESHKKLYLNLVNYKKQEECKSISNIEDSALKFYTEINKHDHELEKIHSINFKEDNSNYRILLRLSDGRELDAFCILSEGHLRSLGLSLLLAICEKQNHPTIIFDDVVNAIDSDHRKNIIELFIADPYLSKTQRIITTHDRLFWERICNYCSQDSEFISRVMKYYNDGIVLLEQDVSFKSKIEKALDFYDIRQALVYSRIWLESMVNNYCISNGIEVKAKFSERNYRKNNLLEISLEDTYRKFEDCFSDKHGIFLLLKKDLVNWQGQNQEHHGYDEYNLNFSHSTTSDEVRVIYESLCKLEMIIDADIHHEKLISKRESLENEIGIDIKRYRDNKNFIESAPPEIVNRHLSKIVENEKLLSDTVKLIDMLNPYLSVHEVNLADSKTSIS